MNFGQEKSLDKRKEIDAEERVRVKEIDYEIQFNPKTDDVKTMR